jgi:DNA invertase Pin-like site-specific DNA recombinase
VGAVFSLEASRLARNSREWHALLEFCSVVGVLLIDAQAIYDPRLTNDCLILGVTSTISEIEVATFRERAQSASMQMAQRGDLVRRVAFDTSKESMVVSREFPTHGSGPLSI